ncbi:MAG: hypothetical protein F4123_00560 [Gemmatimonadetes bacterium]|nr:hypothetical protein [Gemmatimonadota bacterium]MYB99394.1 hypothetical protein [Gemmatimonadota bacterium]MYI44886.1 hypothetical protein [Gemmatimonadota bacterium]
MRRQTGQSLSWCSVFHPARLAEHWARSEAERDDLRFRARWELSDDEVDARFTSEHRGLDDDQIRTALDFHRAVRHFAENVRREHYSNQPLKDVYEYWVQALARVMDRCGLRRGDPLDDQFAVSQLGTPDGLDFWTELEKHLEARDYADLEAAEGGDRRSAFLAYRWARENCAAPAAEPVPLNRGATTPVSFVQSFDLGCRDRGSGEDAPDSDGDFRRPALSARPGTVFDVLIGRLRHLDAAAGFSSQDAAHGVGLSVVQSRRKVHHGTCEPRVGRPELRHGALTAKILDHDGRSAEAPEERGRT